MPESLPIVSFKKLWHVGEIDITKKRPGSHEGQGLSVSTHPDAWEQINSFTAGPHWELTKPGNRFLAFHKMSKPQRQMLYDWGIQQGYVESVSLWRTMETDENGERAGYFEFDNVDKALEQAGYDSLEQAQRDGAIKENKKGFKPTPKFDAKMSEKVSQAFVLDFLAVIYAEEVLNLDGVWWADRLSIEEYSAPRGVIFNEKLPSWNKQKVKTGAVVQPLPLWAEELQNNSNVRVAYARKSYEDWYVITINNPVNPSYIALFVGDDLEGKTVGRMYTDPFNHDGKKYMRVKSIDIPKKYQGQGLGKAMYKALLEHTDTAGIASYLPDRINKKQIPKIYKAFGGYSDGDWGIIPKTAGGRRGYTAFVLTPEARAAVLKAFPPKFPDVIAHHVTIHLGTEKPLPAPAEIKVVGYASDESLEAVVVSVDGTTTRPDGETYHVTLSLDRSKGRKPMESMAVCASGWEPVTPFEIQTIPQKVAMQVDESPFNKERRQKSAYTELVLINATKFKSLWEEQHPGETLNWNPARMERLAPLESVDDHPKIYIDHKGNVDVGDGRHRITTAARRGANIWCATPPGTQFPEGIVLESKQGSKYPTPEGITFRVAGGVRFGFIIKAWLEDENIGHLLLKPYNHVNNSGDEIAFFIGDVKVLEEFREHGIGLLLYKEAIRIAKSKGAVAIYQGIPQTENAAVIWNRLGKEYNVKTNEEGSKFIRLAKLKMADTYEFESSTQDLSFDVESYLHGRCHIFALALHKALSFPMEFLWDNAAWGDEDEEFRALVHAYCCRPDGTYVDAQGTLTREQAMEDYGDEPNEPEFVLTTESDINQAIAENLLEPPASGEVDNLVKYIRANSSIYLEYIGRTKIANVTETPAFKAWFAGSRLGGGRSYPDDAL